MKQKGRSRAESLFGSRESWGTAAQDTEEMARDQRERNFEGPWRGFLIIQCEHCGKVRAFNAKREIYVYKCECGEETPLQDLRPLYLRCKCGADFRYKTNLQDEETEHKCITCGNMVKMRLNRRGTAYVTVSEQGHRRAYGEYLPFPEVLGR